MSGTRARQAGRVQLEQSDMHLASNMAKMGKGGFPRAAIEDTQNLIKTPRAKDQRKRKRGVVFPGHNKLKAAIERHLELVHETQMDGCLPRQHGSAKHPQSCRRRKGTDAPPPQRALPRSGTPPLPSDDDEISKAEGVPPAYVYLHTPLPSARFVPRIAYVIKILFQIC
jgi:hypothetical protein